jgi:hypothetical protein
MRLWVQIQSKEGEQRRKEEREEGRREERKEEDLDVKYKFIYLGHRILQLLMFSSARLFQKGETEPKLDMAPCGEVLGLVECLKW